MNFRSRLGIMLMAAVCIASSRKKDGAKPWLILFFVVLFCIMIVSIIMWKSML